MLLKEEEQQLTRKIEQLRNELDAERMEKNRKTRSMGGKAPRKLTMRDRLLAQKSSDPPAPIPSHSSKHSTVRQTHPYLTKEETTEALRLCHANEVRQLHSFFLLLLTLHRTERGHLKPFRL